MKKGDLKLRRGAEQFSWPQEFSFSFCLNISVWNYLVLLRENAIVPKCMIGTSQVEIL